jgi:hypothetical protein
MKRNIYQGPESCWAQREHVYVPGSGINAKSAEGILALMDKELRRGWTYDHNCRRVKMTPELARRRAWYLVALAEKHSGKEEAKKVAEIVDEWLERRGLMKKAKKKAAVYVSA